MQKRTKKERASIMRRVRMKGRALSRKEIGEAPRLRELKGARLTTLLRGLVEDGSLIRVGSRKGARYHLPTKDEKKEREFNKLTAEEAEQEPVQEVRADMEKVQTIADLLANTLGNVADLHGMLDTHRQNYLSLRAAVESFLAGHMTMRDLACALDDGVLQWVGGNR